MQHKVTPIFTMRQELQETHQSMREFLYVEHERQKTNYDRSKFVPSYKIKELLVLNRTAGKGGTRKFTSFYKRPYTIVEIKN